MQRSRDDPIVIAGGNLRIDAAAVEALRAFEAAGVEALLLKGRTLASWLYGAGETRPYNDCDLLVRPEHAEQAEAVLADLGFVRLFDDRVMPDWWREHASEWWRDADGVLLDLHQSVIGIGVDVETAWRSLSADATWVDIAGHRVPALALPARALHVAMHAAQHGVEFSRPRADLERAATQVDIDIWRAAADLARALAATEALAVGLRLVPAGAQLADRLALPSEASADTLLRATTPPPVALGLEQLARARGTRRRASYVWHKIMPPAAFMRKWHPLASRGRLGLLLAYLWRPLWILRRMPVAYRAWSQVRRVARRP